MKIRCDKSRLEEEAAALRNQNDNERFTDLRG